MQFDVAKPRKKYPKGRGGKDPQKVKWGLQKKKTEIGRGYETTLNESNKVRLSAGTTSK